MRLRCSQVVDRPREEDAEDDALTGLREVSRVDVLRELRASTGVSHESVEESLDLLAADLGAERLGAVLACLLGFHAAAEASLERWAARHAVAAEVDRLDWPARRKAHLLTADLVALGRSGAEVDRLPRMTTLAPIGTAAGAYGRLYVVEGSTLGGQVIARRLRALDGLFGALPSFTPYGRATGPRWHAFRCGLRSWVGGDRGRADAVVAAAVDDFDALAAWCAPLAVRSVA